MFEIFGIPSTALFGQLLIGLINGSFYALLSLGLAVIFGMLNIINFSARRPVHDGRVRRLSAAAIFRHRLLAGADRGAGAGRHHRHHRRAAVPAMALQARPPLRPAADLRARADHRGRVPQLFRLGRPALHRAGIAAGRPQSRLHVPAQLSRLGDRGLADGLPRHLVRDRAHAARRLPARRDREPDAGARLRHQRAAHDHADLRLRRRARRLRRRDGGADLQRVAADGLRTDHRRVRGGGDRRHGVDPRRHRHRLRRSA